VHGAARIADLEGCRGALDFDALAHQQLDEALFAKLAPKVGDRFQVSISRSGAVIYTGELPYVASFGEVALGTPLLYLNSLLNVSFALNRGDFATTNKVGRGAEWGVRVKKINAGAPAVAK
jgi:S-adenosylmethionine hydrolase